MNHGAGVEPYAVRKRSRKAFIFQTGVSCFGCRPSAQFQAAILSRTFGSLATIETGTSRLAWLPLTRAMGWWSPRKISTVFLLPYFTR